MCIVERYWCVLVPCNEPAAARKSADVRVSALLPACLMAQGGATSRSSPTMYVGCEDSDDISFARIVTDPRKGEQATLFVLATWPRAAPGRVDLTLTDGARAWEAKGMHIVAYVTFSQHCI